MTDIFQDSFEHAPIGICHTAGDGTFLRVNRRFADMLGYTAEDLYRRRLPEITHPEDVEADAVSHAFPADRKGEVTIRMRMVTSPFRSAGKAWDTASASTSSGWVISGRRRR